MGGLHDSQIGGHMGVRKTLEKVRRRFYWPGQKSDVVKWCSNCILHVTPESPLQEIQHLLKSAMQVDLWRGYNRSPT